MERKFGVKDSSLPYDPSNLNPPYHPNLIYDSSLVSQTNSQMKAPMFARFTWTQSLHALHKPLVSDDVEGILDAFSEDRKRYERMKQQRFTLADIQESQAPLPKAKPLVPPFRKPPPLRLADTTEDEDAEDQTRARKGQRTSLVSRVTTGLDRLEALILTSRSNEGESVKEQLAEVSRNSQKRRLFQTNGWQRRYEDLFREKELCSEKTVEMDRAFVTRIEEIQKQLSPDYKGTQSSTEELTRKRLGSSQMRVYCS